MDQSEWTSRAQPQPELCVEIGFRIFNSFYYGPENGFSPLQWQQLREDIYRPKIPLRGEYVLTKHIEAGIQELVAHYQDVLRLASRHARKTSRIAYHFHLRPMFFGPDDLEFTFPWYDTLRASSALFGALGMQHDGLRLHDFEQGWEFHAFADGDRLFMRQGDFDSGEEKSAIVTSRTILAQQFQPVLQRAEHIVEHLVQSIGFDYWSQQ